VNFKGCDTQAVRTIYGSVCIPEGEIL